VEEVEIAPLSGIESVQNDVLDSEHEECVAALNGLAHSKEPSALEAVYRTFVDHFKHEESLLNDHVYAVEEERLKKEGGTSLLLDSRRSHYSDHKKMLEKVQTEYSGAVKEGRLVSSAFVNRLFRDFEHHANVYDGHYAEKLAAALA